MGGLAPHPIVVRKGLVGALATRLRAVILTYAGASNLVRFTQFRSASLSAPPPAGTTGESRFWNFHGFDVGNGTTPIEVPTLPVGTLNQNLISMGTMPLHSNIQPATGSPDDMPILAYYPSAQQASVADLQSAYDAALRIENPGFHSSNTIDCASCHLAQPARQLVGEQHFGLSAAGDSNAFTADPSIPPADTVSVTSVLDGDGLNLHAFSYRDSRPMINQRVVNETAAFLVYVNTEVLGRPSRF